MNLSATNPKSKYRIRYKDCDPLGHLNNTRYLDYMLDAREDHLIDVYGFDLFDYAQQRSMAWVVTSHQISYRREARRNEEIIIQSALIHFDEKRLNPHCS
ncbi:MAG: acyl-CoA thioesterase [Bacteroidota bacterium]|nr:acyl-CoA thioesterase [Bacteroidota bacterium]